MPRITKRKRAFSFSAPKTYKRRAIEATSSKVNSTVPRGLRGSTFLTRTVAYSVTLGGNVFAAFAWSQTSLWVNGTSAVTIDGAGDITALFDLVRVAKVDCHVNFNYSVVNTSGIAAAGTLATVRDAPDYNDCIIPTDSSLNQMQGVRFRQANSQMNLIKTTVYPRVPFTQSNGAATGPIDIRMDRKSIFVPTGLDIPFYGWKVSLAFDSADAEMVAFFKFIVHYECRGTK